MKWAQINQTLCNYWWVSKINSKQNFQMKQYKNSRTFTMLSNMSLDHFGPHDLNSMKIFNLHKQIKKMYGSGYLLCNYKVLSTFIVKYNSSQNNINNIIETKKISKFIVSSLQTGSDYKYSCLINCLQTKREKMSICIGEGGFANVYLQVMNGKFIACKKIDLPRPQPMRYLLDEINAFRSLDHPNIVKFLGYRHLFSSFEIAFEYVRGSTLDEKYIQFRRKGLGDKQSEQLLFYWIFQITLALIELEQEGIVHRDLKHRNILVNEHGLIKIIDFGISKILYSDSSSVVGTIGYMAPELIFQGKVSTKSDVWSLGTTIYTIIYDKIPFQSGWLVSHKMIYLDQSVFNKGIKFDDSKCSQEMNSLLKMMLQMDPKKRISAKEILNHPALKSRQASFASQYRCALNKN